MTPGKAELRLLEVVVKVACCLVPTMLRKQHKWNHGFSAENTSRTPGMQQPLSSPEGPLNVSSWRCHLWEVKTVVVSLENKELALMESEL